MRPLLFSFIAFLSLVNGRLALATTDDSRMLVHLLSYIRADFGGAVENGKVVNRAEYQEQIDFLKQASQLIARIPELETNAEFKADFAQFEKAVQGKQSATKVAGLAGDLETRAIHLAKIEVTPRRWPDLHNGKAIYDRQCAQCHGSNGQGDGPSGRNLEPKPTNFQSAKLDELPPFQAYNTIRLGVPGTGMASFHDLSPAQTWDLAFYVLSLRYPSDTKSSTASEIPLKEAATLSDSALAARWGETLEQARPRLAKIRRHQERSDASFYFEARRLLDLSREQIERGEWADAKRSAVASYLEGIEPIEAPLRQSNPALIESLELKMAEIRNAIDAQLPETRQLLREAESLVILAEEQSKKSSSSPWVTFFISFGIIMREALEAILVLITVLGVTKSVGSKSATRAIHVGWISAVALGLVTWLAAGHLIHISGADREWLEGIVALIAVVVLIYMGFWLHQKTEIGKWRQFVEKMVNQAVERKSLLAFVILSFTTVYREIFESVLFLQALSLEVGNSQNLAVGAGAITALVVMLSLTQLATRLSVRLPVRQLCQISSWTMIALAIVLLGKAVHAFQEVGVIPMTLLPGLLRFELLGIFPTYETFAAQALGFLAITGLYFFRERPWARRSAL